MEEEPNTKIQLVVNQSGLETTKAKEILAQFDEFFGVADDWELKAKTIVVTDASQTDDMKIARIGRMFLGEKRRDIEKARKALKDSALKEGQMIDSVAKILTGVIVPIEKYLKTQEDFVKIKEEEEKAAKFKAFQEEEDRKHDEAVKTAEEAERRRQAAIVAENTRLKEEADKQKVEREEERKANEDKLAEDRKIADEKREAERIEHEAELEEVHRKQEAENKIRADELAKELEQRKKEQDKRDAELKAAQEETARLEAEKLELEGKITCPFCNKTFDR